MRPMRRFAVLFAVVVGAGVAGWSIAWAVSPTGFVLLENAVFKGATGGASTSSDGFRDLPGLSNIQIQTCPPQGFRNMTATLSVHLKGAPAEFRVRLDDQVTLGPGVPRFNPTRQNRSFSWTFVGPLPGPTDFPIDVQWRSPKGERVEMTSGNLMWLQNECG